MKLLKEAAKGARKALAALSQSRVKQALVKLFGNFDSEPKRNFHLSQSRVKQALVKPSGLLPTTAETITQSQSRVKQALVKPDKILEVLKQVSSCRNPALSRP